MVKRFCDNEIWLKDWFLDLSIKQKLLLKFLFDNCDCAGIYEISYRTLKNCFNEEISKKDFEGLRQIKFLNENTIFIEDFINFQCSIDNLKALNPNNNAHKGIIKRLKKYNLYSAGANEPLTSPSLGALCGAQEKEKEKDTEKEKEKDISSSLVLSSSLEVDQSVRRETSENDQSVRRDFSEEQKDLHIYGKYNNVCMSVEQYNKLLGICASQKLLDELIDNLSENIETGKEHPFRSDFPNTHFVRIQQYRKYRLQNPEKFKNVVTTSEESDGWSL